MIASLMALPPVSGRAPRLRGSLPQRTRSPTRSSSAMLPSSEGSVTVFGRMLRERQVDPAGRRWLFVPYDQLSDAMGPLSREGPRTLGIVLVENPWKAARRPYHKQKLALVLANLRQFALEQAARGVAVRHVVARSAYRGSLEPLISALGPLRGMEPAERELRSDLAPLVESGHLSVIPHEGWLTAREQFQAAAKQGPPWRMDAAVLDIPAEGPNPVAARLRSR